MIRPDSPVLLLSNSNGLMICRSSRRFRNNSASSWNPREVRLMSSSSIAPGRPHRTELGADEHVVNVKLTDSEKAFLDGTRGKAQQKAMELLVRYAEALGAERFVDTNNVAGVPGSANPFLQDYYKDKGTSEYDAIFSHFDLDSDELVEAPSALVSTCCLQGGADPDNWETLGTKPQVFGIYKDREQFAADH